MRQPLAKICSEILHQDFFRITKNLIDSDFWKTQ